MDEAEQMPASVVHNFTRGKTTFGQASWDLGDRGSLAMKGLSVLFEFAFMLDALQSSFTACLGLLSDSSFSFAARACWRVGEVNRNGCG